MVLAVLALAAFLRFYDLAEESLWVDELYSLSFVSGEDTAEVVALTQAWDTPPSTTSCCTTGAPWRGSRRLP